MREGFSIKIGHTTKAPAKRGKDSAKKGRHRLRTETIPPNSNS